MAAGDVTLLQDGAGVGTENAKMHPYVIALVRWCVSCVWSAATVVVHRLLYTPLPITGTKHHACLKVGRAATRNHIHPEPLVHCQVLRTPDVAPEVDFIFLHGLYGSLENTWKQGDWRSKYKIEPNKVPLKRPHSIPDTCACDDCKCRSNEPYKPTYKNTKECTCNKNKQIIIKTDKDRNDNDRNENDNEKIYIRNENDNVINRNKNDNIIQNLNDNDTTVYDKEMFITEGFYATDLTCVDEYEVQARFVQDLFSLENEKCDKENCDFLNKNDNRFNNNNKGYVVCKDEFSETDSGNNYSYLENKDFLSISKPTDKSVLNSFVNSENNVYKYENDKITSDLKNINSKNQTQTLDINLDKNSEQNKSNKVTNDSDNIRNENETTRNENDTTRNENDITENKNEKLCEVGCGCICDKCYSTCWPKDWLSVDYPNARIISVNYTSDPYLWRPLWVKECKRLRLHERAEQMTEQLISLGVGERPIIWVGHSKGGLFIKQIYAEGGQRVRSPHYQKLRARDIHIRDIRRGQSKRSAMQGPRPGGTAYMITVSPTPAYEAYLRTQNHQLNKLGQEEEITCEPNVDSPLYPPIDSQELESLYLRSRVWAQSGGFMFYSVPHRGSPLANIATPITARSIELTEISQDCSLVLTLQARWLSATRPLNPAVRSLVETNRTLMAVLWLRIVSVESADAGIGALCGVSVDHREICKPSSRSCVLYTELLKLVHASLNRWRCVNQSE